MIDVEERREILQKAVCSPLQVKAERCKRSLFHFMHEFWPVVSPEEPRWNWHIEILCNVLMETAYRVVNNLPKQDIIINIPPGTTKSITCSIMFPSWCWTNWPWMRFIVGSYSGQLSLEHAEISRDLIRSGKFKDLFPDLDIKQDKDTKSNFRIVQNLPDGTLKIGGNRYSTSVGGTLTGFHGHILIVDDPLNPKEAASEVKLRQSNHWMEQTLSTRKIDKAICPTILIMQRLHEDDPAGHMLAKKKVSVRHICLPGESRNYGKFVRPVELLNYYINDLLDPVRMPWAVLEDLEMDLGQFGYAGQIGQNPVPPGGGMFKVDHFQVISETIPLDQLVWTVRYWDKAASTSSETRGKGAQTSGCKMSRLKNGKFLIHDVKSGRWATNERESIIRQTAEADGSRVHIFMEQEPGSGGKDSAQFTIINLAGFKVEADRPTGDKVYRADPYSVQVNNGNVLLQNSDWVKNFIDQHRFFPLGHLKDQVDSASGAFTKLAMRRIVRNLLR